MNAAADDVIIVGGGHNGLVAAAYLARAGRRVTVLEARGTLGGAVAGDRIFPGVDARFSRFSYLVSLLPQTIVRRAGPGHRAPFPAGALVHPGRRRWRAGQPRRGRDLAAGPEPARLRDRARAHPHPALAASRRPAGPARSRAVGRAGRAPDRCADRVEHGRRRGPGCAADRCADRHLQLRARSVAAAEPLLPLPRDRQRDRGVAGAGRRHGGGGRRTRTRRDSGRRQPGDQRAGDRDRAVGDRPDHRPAGRRPGAIRGPRAGQLRAGRARPAAGHTRRPTRWAASSRSTCCSDDCPGCVRDSIPRSASPAPCTSVRATPGCSRRTRSRPAGRIPDPLPCEVYCHTLTDRSILGDELRDRGYHTLTLFGLHTPIDLFRADPDGAREQALRAASAVVAGGAGRAAGGLSGPWTSRAGRAWR